MTEVNNSSTKKATKKSKLKKWWVIVVLMLFFFTPIRHQINKVLLPDKFVEWKCNLAGGSFDFSLSSNSKIDKRLCLNISPAKCQLIGGQEQVVDDGLCG